MEGEIKAIIQKYKNTYDYNISITNIKKIIDHEYQNILDEEKEKKIHLKLKTLFEKKIANEKELIELQKIKIKINKEFFEENVADYFLDCRFAYDLWYKKKIFTIALSLCGDRETCNPVFLYKLKFQKNKKDFMYENEDAIKELYEDLKFKHVQMNNLIKYLLALFELHYVGDIYEYCFSNLSVSGSSSDDEN